MSDFETHPIGTAQRLAELESTQQAAPSQGAGELKPLRCISGADGASDYCGFCGADMCFIPPLCPERVERELKKIPQDDVQAYGCNWEAQYPQEPDTRCEKWCGRPNCPVTLTPESKHHILGVTIDKKSAALLQAPAQREQPAASKPEPMKPAGEDDQAVYQAIANNYRNPEPQAQAGEPEYPEPLENFCEGQWWFNELEAMASHSIDQPIRVTADMKRAVAVVRHILKSARKSLEAIAKKDAALKACVEALERVEPHSEYGFFRPENPHDFFPDPESCTADEIANHKAACDAYDAGTYTPDNSDGWITPDLHITKAPWGIGSYTARDPAIVAAITQGKEALS